MRIKDAVAILHIGKLITAERECLCLVHSLAPREALVRTSLPVTVGQSVSLGLRNGYTVPAVVGIVRGEQASLLFEEHVSIATILAEQRNGRDEREAVRVAMTCPVSIIMPNEIYNCMMQDISLFGVKVMDEAGVLEEGAQAQIAIDGLGKRDVAVRWRQGPHAGLNFQVALGFRMLDQWIMQMNG